MGVTLDQLRKSAKKYVPAEEGKLTEAYLPDTADGEVVDVEVVDAQEQDLVESVDLLDQVYSLLGDILASKATNLSKELSYRTSELHDEVGEFLEDMTGLTVDSSSVH